MDDVEPANELSYTDSMPGEEQQLTVVDKELEQEPEGIAAAECIEHQRQRQLEVLTMLNNEEIENYVNHTKDWGTVNKPPHGSEFNAYLCEMLHRVSTFLNPLPLCIQKRDSLFFPILVVMGKNLSGKTAVAKALCMEHNLSLVNSKDVVLTALSSCHEDAETLVAGLPDDLVDIVHERVELGRKAKNEQLDKGLEVSNMVLCQLVYNHIKWIKAKSMTSGANENDPSLVCKPQGILLEGFPHTALQFEIMESLLTTYKPDEEVKDTDYKLAPKKHRTTVELPVVQQEGTESVRNTPEVAEEGEEDRAQQQVVPIQQLTEEEEELLRIPEANATAFDLVLNINVSDTDVLVRYAGERVDPLTGVTYHMEYNPPDDEVVPRLQTIDKSVRNTELLHSKLTAFRHNKKRIIAWLQERGNFEEVDGSVPLEEVVPKAIDVARRVLKQKKDSEEKTMRIKKLREFIAEEKHRYAKEIEARKEAVSPTGESAHTEAREPKKIAPIDVNQEVCQAIENQWKEAGCVYEQGLSEVFIELRKLKKDAVEHFIAITKQFEGHLKKPSNRQMKVEAFQQDFNAFDVELRRDKEGMAELHLRTDTLQSELWKECDTKKEGADLVVQDYTKANWNELYRNDVQMQFCVLVELEITRFVFTKRLIQFYYGVLYCCTLKGDDTLPDLTGPVDDQPKGKKQEKKLPPKGKPKEPEPEESPEEFMKIYKKAIEWIEEAAAVDTEKDSKTAKDPKQVSNILSSEWEQVAEKLANSATGREMELLRYRLEIICSKYYSFIEDFNEKSTSVNQKLTCKLNEAFKREMTAVASLVAHIRTNIEEQTPLLYTIDLTDSRVVVNEASILVPPTEVGELEASDIGDGGDFVTPNLTKSFLLGIISRFRGRAPEGLISKGDFVRLFLQIAATTTDEDEVPRCWLEYGKENFEKAFSSFDWLNKGACDWRSFCTSLLLWSNDSSKKLWKIGAPSLTELSTLRLNFQEVTGEASFISKSDFLSVAYWFEDNVSPTRSQQLKILLWEIFKTTGSEGESEIEVVDVTTFLLYFCPDKQILRGGQKAFAVLSREEGFISRDDLYRIFHYSPYAVCEDAVDDMYSREGIDSVFFSILQRVGFGPDEAATGVITFAQLCAWHVGRVMLNNASMYLQHCVTFE
eukprot:TRINITY_DN1698_c0_g1_i1.p1 TRINITY_DN1698_c0_g1~~TRINITY_DN1698_c0_g1_i1.p1  ORF type:complete len:1151 (+),score=228.39 TRINITY_DN1698_c0_g1_i1:997-4449(+)